MHAGQHLTTANQRIKLVKRVLSLHCHVAKKTADYAMNTRKATVLSLFLLVLFFRLWFRQVSMDSFDTVFV